jgi:4-amino-4-deoxy-L-arabinose transferase-like glycosyltransferase
VGLSDIGGASRPSALLAGMLFLLTPMVIIHLRVAYVDAAFGSMMAASLYLLLRWREALTPCGAAILGLSLGLAAGMKSTGLAFAAVLGLGAILLGVREVRRGRLRCKALILQAGLALAMLMAVGSYWYLRCWWTYGNPIYPVRIQLGSLVFPGLGSLNQLFMAHNTPPTYQGRNPLINIAISWLELGDETYNYYSRNRGLGPVWAAFALPALVPFAVDAWRHRHVPRLLMLGLTALLLVIQPALWWPRYVLYIVPVGLAALAWTYDRLHSMAQSMAAFLIMITLLTSTSLTMAETIEKLPLAMHLQRSQRTFGQLYYGDYAWVDGIQPSRIGHTPMAWIYPLYGGLQHHVQLSSLYHMNLHIHSSVLYLKNIVHFHFLLSMIQ